MYKVSVIVPIYGVERFIERCIHSLFKQTLKEVEFIFVDDASPDKSLDILRACVEQYPERKKDTQILTHTVNQGLPAARNTGLKAATGEYVFHCDSDDWVETDMLEKLYEKATTEDAEIVWCDWYLSFQENERYMHQPRYQTARELLCGLLAGTLKYNVWNKLVKRSLYTDNGIDFPAGHAMGEDMTMILLTECARRVAYLPEAFYHYVRYNTNAYSKSNQEKHYASIRYNVDRVVDFLQKKEGTVLDKDISYFKLNVKLPFLIGTDRSTYMQWEQWYPEANTDIMSNKSLPFRTRLLQYMAWKKQYWYVKLYNVVIINLVYGVIFK